MTIIPDFDLTTLTTFHLPAKSRWFVEYRTIDELCSILSDKRFRGLPKLHIGGGSNLLFTKPYEGVILHSAMTGITREEPSPDTVVLKAESGLKWDEFVRYSVSENLCGLENLAYIPGEVGASAVQNIGAYGVEVKDVIESVKTIDTTTLQPVSFTLKECGYAYRDSIFKHAHGRYIVTNVAFKLSRKHTFTLDYGPLKELKSDNKLTPAKVYARVVEIRRTKLPEPEEIGSAGSFFKNPVVTIEQFHDLKNRYPDIPHYEATDGVKIPAGWLIEHAGLKGYRVGGAEVYPKQCLVLVNIGNATANDVVDLYQYVQATVKKIYGITLEPEVNII